MLPASFPADSLSATDRFKVEWFYNRYVEQFYANYTYGHYLLAGYAAVPGLLTPDLLYKLWQNFNTYRWSGKTLTIHRIAVADILLSPLCKEVGYELYEMHPDIRLAFLQWLKAETATEAKRARGFVPIETITSFLQEYYMRPNPVAYTWGDQYLEAQQLDVLSFMQPERAAGVLKSRIRDAARSGNQTSLLRAIDVFTKTYQRLDRILPEAQRDILGIYEKQSRWLEAGRALVQEDLKRFMALLDVRDSTGDWLTTEKEGAIAVQVETSVAEKLEKAAAPMLKVLIVAVDGVLANRRAMNDAALLESCLTDILPVEQLQITILSGPGLNRQKILAALEQMGKEVNSNDQVLIYFSCDARKDVSGNGDTSLICELDESNNAVGYVDHDIRYEDLQKATDALHSKEVFLVLEAPCSGTDQWMTVTENSGRAIITSCAIDQAPQLLENELIEKLPYSFFTYELVRQLRRKQGQISLRGLFRRVVKGFEMMPQVRAKYGDRKWDIREAHAPQLFASPGMLDASLIPGSRQKVGLQTGLQRLGFYDDEVDGVMTGALERAIHRYRREVLDGRELNNAALLYELNKKVATKPSEAPIFLLVFSDPHKRLKAIAREKSGIEVMLQPVAAAAGIELLIFTDPDIRGVAEVFDYPGNRDRITLFYYSGIDENGDMTLADGSLSAFDFLGLLEYQRNIQLVFMNTCRAMHFAAWAAQTTAAITLGGEETIRDDYAADFSLLFFNKIVRGESLNEYASFRQGWLAYTQQKGNANGGLRLYQAPWRALVLNNPWNLSEVKPLTDEDVAADYEVYFDVEKNKWKVDAGTQKGIQPSLDFMKTLFLVNGIQELYVTDVAHEFSYLEGAEGLDSRTRYPAVLQQNALPKVKVAFSEDVDESSRMRLLEAISSYEIYYTDVIESRYDAKYLIRSNAEGYYLVRNHEVALEEPVFNYQDNPHEFIKQMDYIARWTGILAFDNTRSKIERADVQLSFKIFGNSKYVEQGTASEKVIDPELLTLYYTDGGNPAFSCEVSLSADAGVEACYVNVLYLDALYGVSSTLFSEHQLFAGKTTLLMRSSPGKGTSDVLYVRIEDEQQERGVKSIYDYLKIFISTEPISLEALDQRALHFHENITRGVSVDERETTMRLPDNEWMSIIIPINIKLEDERPSFEDEVEKLYKEREIKNEEDPQKGRWGGKPADNGLRVQASVTSKKLLPGLYNVRITVNMEKEVVAGNKVAIFLHDSFKEEIRYRDFVNGVASIEVSANEAFTLGVYASDGTMLELDLNEITGYPDGFYYRDVSDGFKKAVRDIYKKQPVRVKDDLQKNRWGGESIVNGKQLTATVKKALVPGLYKVRVKITAAGDGTISGDTAFFLHNTFSEEIKFRRIVNGEARISFTAYEAFVVGAYTQDGTMLELDLNKIEGAPDGFYYKDIS